MPRNNKTKGRRRKQKQTNKETRHDQQITARTYYSNPTSCVYTETDWTTIEATTIDVKQRLNALVDDHQNEPW